MIKRILLGIADSTFTASATRHAISIAKRCDASLTGVSIMDYARLRNDSIKVASGSRYSADVRQAAFEDANKSIDAAIDVFVRLCEAEGVPFDFRKVAGDPFQEFITQSKYHDLMVCGLRRLFEHGVLPEPRDELAKLLSAGVRPIVATASQYREIKRVLVAYSDSVESAKTMRRFTQLHPLFAPDATVQVVSFGKAGSTTPTFLIEVRNYMQAHGLDPEIHFFEDTPRTGVLRQAEEWQADMIVLGNSAKSLIRRQVFGETALETIKEAAVPLFLSQ